MPSRLIRNAEDLDALFTLFGNMKLPLTVDWVQGADRTAQQNGSCGDGRRKRATS
jgi:RNAse (barnase) inhibitor barstar